jgi:hypothetical protein
LIQKFEKANIKQANEFFEAKIHNNFYAYFPKNPILVFDFDNQLLKKKVNF